MATEIVIGRHSGFCKGVYDAVETAKKISGEGVYILGELVHNEQVVGDILSRGTKVVHSVGEVPCGSTVIIRSHGAGRKVFEELNAKGVKVVDCTCPFVKHIHRIVERYSADGYQVVILGEPDHPEVMGIAGWCATEAVVIREFDPSIDFSRFEKLCVVAQTTYSVEKYDYFLKNFDKSQCKILEFFKTICYTTFERQKEAEQLSTTCDAVVVIGGLKSSNTHKLFEICSKNCSNVFRIASSDELDVDRLVNFKKIGIVAGASTPREQSMEVLTKMAEATEVEVNAEKTIMDEAVAQFENKQSFKKGDRIGATISSATDSGLFLFIGSKTDVLLAKEDIDGEYSKEEYASKIGDEIEVLVLEVKPKLHVSQKAIVERQKEEQEIKEIADGKTFSVTVTGTNKGGLTGKYGSYEVFIPSSQIRIGYVKELDKYVGKTLRLRAEKVESQERRKQIVASQRVILEEEKAARDAARAEKEEKFFSNIAVDQVVKGKVARFASFGAFVEVDGFDCLAHISDLSWNNVKNPASVLEIGKEYEFLVLKVDKENKKVSIGYKQLQQRPWDTVPEKYAVGDIVTGKIVRIVDFGVFVELEEGVDGLVHISQISHEWLENPTAGLTIGENVDVKILAIDMEKEKITLSIKATKPAPEGVKRAPREKNGEADGEGRARRKPRRERVNNDFEGEYKEWKDSEFSGASIAELINKNN